MSDQEVQLTAGQQRASRRIVLASLCSKLGDVMADAKTSLTWLVEAVGAPPWVSGLLVPIRESGSMLPQLWLAPWVKRFDHRSRVCLMGAVGQALACVAIALCALTFQSLGAGLAVLVVLVFFSLSRSLSSIASKDVMGRCVPEGARGRIQGLAGSIAGIIGAGGSLGAIAFADTQVSHEGYAIFVGLGALVFGISGLLYALLGQNELKGQLAGEPVSKQSESETDKGDKGKRAAGNDAFLLWKDPRLRRFVIVRALLLGSALGGPYFVIFGREQSDTPAMLSAFVLAGGLASALSSWVWGRLSDHRADKAMQWGGALCSAVGLVSVLLRWGGEGLLPSYFGWPLVFFVFMTGYAGVRVGRKTYVIDLAGGDLRTSYVASSNTAIALILLLLGGVGAALQSVSTEYPLLFFSIFCAAGATGSAFFGQADRNT